MEENFESKVDELKVGINELLRRTGADEKSSANFRDELAGLILGDIKRIMGEKHAAIFEQLKSFESLVNSVNQSSDNQKLLVETTRIASDLNTVYTKISAQEMLLQNMYKLVDTIKNDKTPETIAKLNTEFINFARGFEQITITLNKNFTEFLAQVQSYSPKDEFKKLQIDLDGINNNTNAIISALAIIDHKYQDLKSLITIITEKENTFIEGLQELNQIGNQFNSLALSLKTLSSKEDANILNEKITGITTLLSNLRAYTESAESEQKARLAEYSLSVESKLAALLDSGNTENAVEELRSICEQFTSLSASIKDEISVKLADFAQNLSQNALNLRNAFADEFNALKNNLSHLNTEVINLQTSVSGTLDNKTEQMFSHLRDLSLSLSNLKDTVAPLMDGNLNSLILRVEENISRLGEENFIKMHGIIQTGIQSIDDTMEIRLNGNTQILSESIKSVQTDVQSVFSQLATYKDTLTDANKENMVVLRDLIDKALLNVENLRVGNQLKQLAIVIEQNATLIKDSFESMNSNFAQIAENSNIEFLKQLNTSIPGIADKLEIFRTLISNENTKNLEELKTDIEKVLEETRTNYYEITTQLREDCKGFSDENALRLQNTIEETLVSHRRDIEKIAHTALEEGIAASTNLTYELVEQKTTLSNINTKINERFDTVFENINGKFSEQKDAVDRLIEEISNNEKDFIEKFSDASRIIESIGRETSREVGLVILESNSTLKDTLTRINDDVITHIATAFERLNSNLEINCEKVANDVSTKIANSNGLTAQNISELKKSVNELNEQTTSHFGVISDKIASVLENTQGATEKLEQVKADIASKIETGLENPKVEAVLTLVERIKGQIQDLTESEAGYSEISKISTKNLTSKVEQLADEIIKLNEKIETRESAVPQQSESQLDTTALKEFVSGLEFLQNNFMEEFKSEFRIQKDVLKEISVESAQAVDIAVIKKVIQETIENKLLSKKGQEGEPGYSLEDIEADFARLRLIIEHDQKLHMPERLDEIRNIGLENIRMNKKSEQQITGLGEWLDSTSNVIELLAEKIEKAEKLNIQEIKTRLIKSESASAPEGLSDSLNEFMANVSKKYQIQEMKIENIDEKISTLIQRQGDIVDMKAFIDTFHETAMQTKSLIARVEGIENQIMALHSSLEKIITYIEE